MASTTMKLKKTKTKAQISIQFAWIFILIAGAIILIFFVGLVFKQKDISESKLSAAVLLQLETILTGAGVSSGTVNVIDTPQLEIDFTCDKEGFSEYTLGKNSIETPYSVIFSPDQISGRKLITWALEWSAPFKIMNFLYLSDPNTKYVLINPTREVERSFPEELESEITSSINTITTEGFKKIRFVFFDTEPNQGLEDSLTDKDLDVSAVKITPAKAHFYERQEASFEEIGSVAYLDTPSMYGAIFSQDIVSYQCNMKKAMRRLNLVAQIYSDREKELKNYFASYPNPQDCTLYYHLKISKLISHSNSCGNDFDQCIGNIRSSISQIEGNQDTLIKFSCPLIY